MAAPHWWSGTFPISTPKTCFWSSSMRVIATPTISSTYLLTSQYSKYSKKNKCNVGYAFINFISVQYIRNFYMEYNCQKWQNFNSDKVQADYLTIRFVKYFTRGFKESITWSGTSNALKSWTKMLTSLLFLRISMSNPFSSDILSALSKNWSKSRYSNLLNQETSRTELNSLW